MAFQIGQTIQRQGMSPLTVTGIKQEGEFQLITTEENKAGYPLIYFPQLDKFVNQAGRLVNVEDAQVFQNPEQAIGDAREKLRQFLSIGREGEMTGKQRDIFPNIKAPLTSSELSRLGNAEGIVTGQGQVNLPRTLTGFGTSTSQAQASGAFRSGTQQLSLVSIWDSRPDLQQAFPQGTVPGTPDNQALNNWWNQYGVREYPNTQLVSPDQTTGIEETGGIGETGETGETDIFNETIQALRSYLDELKDRGLTIDPDVEITPEMTAEFLAQAEAEINPYYSSQLRLARENLLRDVGYTQERLFGFETELEKKYGLSTRRIGEQAAERGFALSGVRQEEERQLAEDTQRQIEATRRQLQFGAGTVARTFAEQYGTEELPTSPFLGVAPRALPGEEKFERMGAESPFFELSDNVYQGLIGQQEFTRRGAIQTRTSELEEAERLKQSLKTQRQLTF